MGAGDGPPHCLPSCIHQTCRTQRRNRLLIVLRSSVGLCKPSLDRVSRNCHGSTWEVYWYVQIDKKWLFVSKPYKRLLLINCYSQRARLMLTSHRIAGYLRQFQAESYSPSGCGACQRLPSTRNRQSSENLSVHFQTYKTLLQNSALLCPVLASLTYLNSSISWLIHNSTHMNNAAYNFSVQNQSTQKESKMMLSRDNFLYYIKKIICI